MEAETYELPTQFTYHKIEHNPAYCQRLGREGIN
jgi:hypothetical protein